MKTLKCHVVVLVVVFFENKKIKKKAFIAEVYVREGGDFN